MAAAGTCARDRALRLAQTSAQRIKHRTLMTCACGEQFCITHFSPATHRCKHVSKHGDRQALADSMVSAAFEKLERL